MNEEIERLAEKIYDYCCANSRENKSGGPREIGSPFADLYEGAKHHYRTMAKWHLENK